MNTTVMRLRYSQIFIICLLGVSLYVAAQSLSGGISKFATNLWGRQALVSVFTAARLKMGDRVFLQALVGKDGWLIFRGDLDGYQNVDEPGAKELKSTQQRVKKLYAELQKRNITLILVIAPDKATIYPDKLPDEIQILNKRSKLNAFKAYLQQHGPPVLVDLRPGLQQSRKQQDVYYKTDTHWNSYGAFSGYTQIMQALSKTYPQLAPNRINDFNLTIVPPSLHDIPKIMGARDLLEPGIRLTLKKNDTGDASEPINEKIPALLMYMDSFGYGLRGFLSLHFTTTTTFLVNSLHSKKEQSLQSVDNIKPNVVIIEMVERNFNVNALNIFLTNFLSRKN